MTLSQKGKNWTVLIKIKMKIIEEDAQDRHSPESWGISLSTSFLGYFPEKPFWEWK
jgi:hypothetical protein